MNVSYFENFKGSPSLVFSSNDSGFQSFLNVLLESDGPISFNKKKVKSLPNTSSLREVIIKKGTSHSIRVLPDGSIEWCVSTDELTNISGLIEGLIKGKSSGHQYVNSNNEVIQIIFSKNEYKFG